MSSKPQRSDLAHGKNVAERPRGLKPRDGTPYVPACASTVTTTSAIVAIFIIIEYRRRYCSAVVGVVRGVGAAVVVSAAAVERGSWYCRD